jgi:hypothetical protein
MKTIRIILFLIIMSFLIACHDNDGFHEHYDVVYVTENIFEPTTWYDHTVYIIVKYDFYVEDILTIEPGAIIKFHPDDGPYMMMSGFGKVLANGTSSNPIIFTSYHDDEHGGDNNENGSHTEPYSRDWGEINTNGTTGSSFRYCEFYYGGSVLFNATLTIYGGEARIEHCKFINNDGSFDHVGVLDASDAESGTIIRNNIFYNNQRPLSISSFVDIDDSNIFHNPENEEEDNQYNGIFVNMLYSITGSRQWLETEVAFVIDGYQRYIDAGGSLTLGNNVVIKFCRSGELWLEEGAGQLINHDGTGIYFTSYLDDSKKGDTNGDGGATSPSTGDWSGIYDNSLSIPYPYFFTWDNILYDSY